MAAFIKKKVTDSGRNLEELYMSPYEGLQRVRQGNFAFYCERNIAEEKILRLFKSHEVCDTKRILFRRHFPAGIIVNKMSPYRERLLINWLRISESGVSNQILTFWESNKAECDIKAYFTSVRIEYVSVLFLFLYLAVLLSICILCLEILIAKITRAS